jgi:hypothetical protein
MRAPRINFLPLSRLAMLGWHRGTVAVSRRNVNGSSCLPAFSDERRFSTKSTRNSRVSVCDFDVTLPFSSIMTRVHFTAFSYPTLQLLLTPPQLFGFTPHLSSSSPLISSHLQTVSFSARSLPIEPENAHFSIRHRSRESCTRKPPRSTPRSDLAALQGFLSVQWGRVATRLGQRHSYFDAQQCNTRTLPDKRDVRH